MPRYYFDTFDHLICLDEEGQTLPNLAAARREARRTLGAIMRDHKGDESSVQYRAEVRDDNGKRMLMMTLQLSIEEGS